MNSIDFGVTASRPDLGIYKLLTREHKLYDFIVLDEKLEIDSKNDDLVLECVWEPTM